MSVSFTPFWMLRLIRYGVGIIFATVTLYVLLCAYVNWSGARHWAEVKARIEGEGETFDFKKLLPPAVDKATNFCAIDALDGIAGGDDESPAGIKRKALEALGWESNGAPPLQAKMVTNEKMDFDAWAKFARDTMFVQMPPDSGNPARDLLEGLERSQPLLAALADAAVVRPDAAFTPLLRDRPLTSPFVLLPVPHYASIFKTMKALALRAQAANECGNTAAAIASVQAMLRISEAVSKEPLWIGMLVSLTCDAMAQRTIWSILEKRTASDQELKSVQATLERMHIEQRVLAALRGELAAAVDSFSDRQRKSGGASFVRLVKEEAEGVGVQPVPWSMKVLNYILPAGMVDESLAVLVAMEYEGAIKPLKTGSYAGFSQCESMMLAELQPATAVLHPSRFSASRGVVMLTSLIGKFYGVLAVNRQCIIACALERYYLQHKAYPAALTDLVPQMLNAVPNDPMDDKLMRYRRTSDERYMLWSIAFDLTDDDGEVISPGQRYERKSKGDWTWQYTPVN